MAILTESRNVGVAMANAIGNSTSVAWVNASSILSGRGLSRVNARSLLNRNCARNDRRCSLEETQKRRIGGAPVAFFLENVERSASLELRRVRLLRAALG